MDESVDVPFGKPDPTSDEDLEHEFARRFLCEGVDSKNPLKVHWPAFRMLPEDRTGKTPHGVSCHALGGQTKEQILALHSETDYSVKSGHPGICFTSRDKVGIASNLDENNPLELLQNEDLSDKVRGKLHHLLRCPTTDCDKPEGFQAGPTKPQAQFLALNATLGYPFTPKPKEAGS